MFVRISRALPSEKWRHEAVRLVRELVALYMAEPGCLLQGVTEGGAGEQIVRIGLWEDRKAAQAAACRPRSLALRAELLPLCREAPDEEGYEVSGGFRKPVRAAQEHAAA